MFVCLFFITALRSWELLCSTSAGLHCWHAGSWFSTAVWGKSHKTFSRTLKELKQFLFYHVSKISLCWIFRNKSNSWERKREGERGGKGGREAECVPQPSGLVEKRTTHESGINIWFSVWGEVENAAFLPSEGKILFTSNRRGLISVTRQWIQILLAAFMHFCLFCLCIPEPLSDNV